MPERSVSVKLSARVEPYIAAMAQAKAATTGLAASGARDLTRLGGQMQSFGRTATLGVSVPLLALGAGSVAMAMDFETAFARMVGLANVPAEEIDGLKESVLALAGETAVAPRELAEALYFAASAGLDSAAAMEAVEVAAKASASGMGSTADIVGLVSSAVASYGAANITAAEATDILTATIREGRADPEELAGSLGRILPIASDLGVTFGEVGGVVAYMTNIMGDTDRAVTGVNDALVKLSAPTEGAKAILLEMGTSVEELHAAIAEDGLLGGLELLREHGFAGNAEAIRQLMPDMQGAVTMTALLNDESGTLTETIGATTNATGSLGDAWAAMSETDAQKMKQALTDIGIAMVQVGTVLLPVAASIASAIGDMVGWFSDLDPAVQTVVIGFAGLAAVIGPVVFIAGAFIKNLVAIKGAMTALAASSVTPWLLGIAAAATVAFIAYRTFGGGQSELEKRTLEVGEALVLVQGDVFRYALQAEGAEGAVAGLAAAQAALSQALLEGEDGTKITQALGILGRQTTETADILIDIGTNGVAALYRLAVGAGVAADKAEILARIVADSDDEFDIAAAIVDQLGAEYLDVGMSMEEMQDQAEKTDLSQVAQEGLAAAAASSEMADQMIRFIEGATGMSRTGEDAVTVYQMYGEALGMADQATQDLVLSTDESGASLDAMATGAEGAGDATDLAGEKTLYFADAVKRLAGPLFGAAKASDAYIDSADEVAEVTSTATALFDDLSAAADRLSAAMEQVTGPADDLREATRAVYEENENLIASFEENGPTLDNATEAGRANQRQLEASRDAIFAHGVAMVQNGASAEDAAGDIAYNTEQLKNQLREAGFTEEAIASLIDQYNLTPEDIATVIRLEGEAYANEVIGRYNSMLDEIPNSEATVIEALIDEGAYAEADRRLDFLALDRTMRIHAITMGVAPGGARYGRRAEGGYIGRPELSWIGEAGPEVILPLRDPMRMRQLVDDSRVGEPLLAALSGMMTASPTYTSSPSSTPAQRSDLPPIYVYNNGREITPHDIARAIVESRAA